MWLLAGQLRRWLLPIWRLCGQGNGRWTCRYNGIKYYIICMTPTLTCMCYHQSKLQWTPYKHYDPLTHLLMHTKLVTNELWKDVRAELVPWVIKVSHNDTHASTDKCKLAQWPGASLGTPTAYMYMNAHAAICKEQDWMHIATHRPMSRLNVLMQGLLKFTPISQKMYVSMQVHSIG